MTHQHLASRPFTASPMDRALRERLAMAEALASEATVGAFFRALSASAHLRRAGLGRGVDNAGGANSAPVLQPAA